MQMEWILPSADNDTPAGDPFDSQERAIIEQHQTNNPDYVQIWDLLAPRDSARRQRVIREIQRRQQDNISNQERERRIQAIVDRERREATEKLRQDRELLEQRLEQARREAEQEVAAEQWRIRDAKRHIDLDE